MRVLSKVIFASVCVLISLFSFAQSKKYPSLLWEITGNGLKKPSYLFGTMHVSSKMVFHLSDSFYYAIKSADVVALEQNPAYWQRDMMEMDQNGQLIGNYMRDGANNYLNETSFQLQSYDEDIRAALTDAPLVVNGLLYRSYQSQEDYEENTYLDLYIYQTGKKLGKIATGVEDYYQTERIVVEAYQDAVKDKNKRGRGTNESSFEIQKKIQAAYRQGDLDALDSLSKYEYNSPAFLEKFLYKRNGIQAHSIDTILQHNSLFVGVGAAHLPGKRGVIELLRKMGYRLRPVAMQDRNAERKDEIDKLKVPVQFRDVQTEDGFVSMKLPGTLYKRSSSSSTDGGSGNESWQYADMENGTYYTVIRVKTHAALMGESNNDVLKKTDSLLYENIPGRIILKTVTKQDDYPAINITNRTRRGDLQRYRIVITPFEEVVCKMSGNDEYVSGEEADVFFNSIHVAYHPQQPQAYRSNGGFAASFPQLPFVSVDKDEDKLLSADWEALDSANGNAYAVWKKTINNYDFLEEDTFDLSLIEESLKRSKTVSREVSRSFSMQDGFHALDMSFILQNGTIVTAKAILRGAQYYLFMQAGKKKEAAAGSFFSTCRMIPFPYTDAKPYSDTSAHFSVQTSVVPKLDTFLMGLAKLSAEARSAGGYNYSGYRSPYYVDKTAFFQNDTTGEAVLVTMSQYPRYYYSKDSASFWEDVIDTSSYRSFIMKSKEACLPDKMSSGYKIVWQDTNTVRQITIMYLLKQNRLFQVTAMSDTVQGESPFQKTFFASFRADDDSKGFSVFTNKQDALFAGYQSKDSATHAEADDAIASTRFTCAALPKFSDIIRSFAYGSKNYFENKSRFIHELGFLNDTPCVKQTEALLSKLYRQTADTAYFQNEILSALARLKTANAYDTLQALLLQDPPVFDDDDDDYDNLFDLVSDSLPLARRMFPGLLQLSAIESYKLPVNHLLQTLVDSGLVKDTVYKSYFSRLYFDAKIEMKKMQNDDERLMQTDDNEEDNDNDVVRAPYRFSSSDYTVSSDELSTYSSLLMPFYDSVASVPLFFQRQLNSKNPSVQMEAAITLASHKKPVPDSVWRSLAAKDKWRSVLFKKLEAIHRKELFPSSAISQEDMARSVLLSEGNAEKFADIQFAGKKTISLAGKKGTVYFFKYKLSKDDEWNMGISGLQPVSIRALSADDKLTKMTGKNLSDDKADLQQFEEELNEMILSEHESAKRFFNDNQYSRFNYDSIYGN